MTVRKNGLISANFDSYLTSDNPLGANNDLDIIKSWLQHAASNSKYTFYNYLKEVKRICLYCDSIGIHYTEVKALDINNYLGILKNPPAEWLKNDEAGVQLKTQILLKPLSTKSVEYAQGILKNFYNFLVNSEVIRVNPVNLSVKIKVEEQYHISGKSLSFDAWDYLSAWLKHESIRSNQENRSKAVRDRWLMNLLYHTAIRRSSVIGLSMNAFKMADKGKHRVWCIEVHTKGNKNHEIIASEELMNELKFYRQAIGLKEVPSENEENIPLIPALNRNKSGISKMTNSISLRGVNFVITESLKLAASDCEDYFIAQELLKTTPHTFRHTSAIHRLNIGIDLASTQHHLGHKSINTTMIYLQDTQDHQVDENEKFNEILRNRVNKFDNKF